MVATSIYVLLVFVSFAAQNGKAFEIFQTSPTPLPIDLVKNTERRILTPHNFSFLLNNPNLCKNAPGPVHTLVVVHSSPINFKRRMSIRRNWPLAGLYPSVHDPEKERIVVAVFVMGNPGSPRIQQKLNFEHDQFGDIVQEDFMDTYKNLSYKNQLWMRYAKEFCPTAKFVLKSDDDMHVNSIALLDLVDTFEKEAGEKGLGKKLFCCRWTGMPALRDEKSKWYVPKTLFQAAMFPAYCSGSAYIVTSEGASAMYEASLRTPFFWVDDVWATGMVPPMGNVTLHLINSLYTFGGFLDFNAQMNRFSEKSQFTQHLFGHLPGSTAHVYSGWHHALWNYGIKIMHRMPPWYWYSPNMYFPNSTFIF